MQQFLSLQTPKIGLRMMMCFEQGMPAVVVEEEDLMPQPDVAAQLGQRAKRY
jgi:hypothetical protein